MDVLGAISYIFRREVPLHSTVSGSAFTALLRLTHLLENVSSSRDQRCASFISLPPLSSPSPSLISFSLSLPPSSLFSPLPSHTFHFFPIYFLSSSPLPPPCHLLYSSSPIIHVQCHVYYRLSPRPTLQQFQVSLW